STFAFRQRPADALAAASQVAAEIVALRHAREHVRHRLAVDHQDALVAIADLGKVALRDGEVAALVGQRLDDDVEIRIAAAAAEDRASAHAVERLEHDVAVLGDEPADLGGVARDDRRWYALWKMQ